MSEPIGTDERLDRIEELEARIKELTELCALEYQRAWLLETQKNIAEEKLAQQDDLVQAAVAAALREAAGKLQTEALFSADIGATDQYLLFKEVRRDVLALIPDAQAALDRVVAAERERCINLAATWSKDAAATIREGGE